MLIDVNEGLWIWRTEHPDWSPEVGWPQLVASVCAEVSQNVVLFDPLAPAPEDDEVWSRFDRSQPSTVVVLKPDHVRDVDLFVRRYGAHGYGPSLFWPDDIPRCRLEPIDPGDELFDGALVALYDGRGRNETPMWIPERRTIVFADALTAPDGELRIWATPWHRERVLPALRDMLELPFERVVVSHGEPVHDRAAFQRALELPPYAE